MRSVFLVVLLAACATTTERAPDESARGCWISREGGAAITMRWFPDAAAPSRLRGDLLIYAASGVIGQQYTLEERPEGWTFCDITNSAAPTCRLVATGPEGDLEDGRVFIDGHGNRLRIALAEPTGEHIVFEGRRDGCD